MPLIDFMIWILFLIGNGLAVVAFILLILGLIFMVLDIWRFFV